MDRVRDLVAAGGVSVVPAQDRDRFAREPAYHYLLRREFEEHGTKIRALNDRGDESPEGELTDGILDQLAKYERAKIAERTRRGKLRKAREGKVIAGRMASYGRAAFGFRYNDSRDSLVLDEERILVVRRMFYMAGVEGRPVYAIKRALDADGVPTPTGKKSSWDAQLIRRYLLSDLYKPHTVEEVQQIVSPEVAATLNSGKCYGVWWWGRSRVQRRQVSEPAPNGDGRRYRYRYKTTERPKEEWTAVPVPDAGIPRGWVDASRDRVGKNRRTSKAAKRKWELSGVVEHHRAEELEARVWETISALLKEPQRLRTGLDAMIEREREFAHGDPEAEMKLWLDNLAEVDQKRARHQEMAADDLISFEELRARIAELDEIRITADQELRTLRGCQEQIRQLEQDKEALLEDYASLVPEALDELNAAERSRVYAMLRVEARVAPEGSLEVSGAVRRGCEMEPLSL